MIDATQIKFKVSSVDSELLRKLGEQAADHMGEAQSSDPGNFKIKPTDEGIWDPGEDPG